MSRNILFVAIGGMLGSVGRFLMVTLAVQLLPSTFPVGTFLVNLIGSFVMGLAVGVAERNMWLDSNWRIFITAGFCGGFTTFSAFAFENVELILDKNYATFAIYSLTTFTICLLAALGGLMISRP